MTAKKQINAPYASPRFRDSSALLSRTAPQTPTEWAALRTQYERLMALRDDPEAYAAARAEFPETYGPDFANDLQNLLDPQQFGPHNDPWWFMPSRLSFATLLDDAQAATVQARAAALKLPAGIPATAVLENLFWRDVAVTNLPAGAEIAAHQHGQASGVLLVVDGELAVDQKHGDDPHSDPTGPQFLRSGGVNRFGAADTHSLRATEPTMLLQVVSPRLRAGCVEHALPPPNGRPARTRRAPNKVGIERPGPRAINS